MPDLAPLPWKKPFWVAMRRAVRDIGEDNLSFVAGGVAFFGFLAVFPAIGALVMIWGIFSDPSVIETQLRPLATAMPSSGWNVLEEQLSSVTSASDEQLTIGAILALGFSLWSATKGARAMIAAMNIAYAQRDRRDFFHANLIAIAFTLGGIVYSVLSLALIAALPPVLEAVQIGAWTEGLIHLGRWIFAIALFAFALSVVYQWAPYRESAPWRWIAPGAVVATLLWIGASFAFSIYAGNFANYNATFGTLGSAVALMMWMWLSSFIVCFGAVLNAELEPGRRGRRVPSQALVAESKKGPALAEPLYLDETG